MRQSAEVSAGFVGVVNAETIGAARHFHSASIVPGYVPTVLENLVNSRFHYQLRLSSDFGHAVMHKSGQKAFAVLAVKGPGGNTMIEIAHYATTRNECNEGTIEMLDFANTALDGLLDEAGNEIWTDQKLDTAVRTALPNVAPMQDLKHVSDNIGRRVSTCATTAVARTCP